MFLIEHGPGGLVTNHGAIDNQGLSLGTIFAKTEIDAILVNHRPVADWRKYVPVRGDRVEVFGKIGDPGTWSFIIGMALQMAIAGIMQALTPQPRRPKMDGRHDAYGIVGFQNTTGQGTPILRAYGENRIHPHVIASGVDTTADHRNMIGRVLYCVGASDDNGWEDLSDVLINDTPADQFEGVTLHYRLGTPSQSVIPGFEDSPNLWAVNNELPWDDDTNTGMEVPYTTNATDVNVLKLVLSFPGGLFRINSKGKRQEEGISLMVWIKETADPDTAYQIVMPGAGEWSVLNDRFWIADSTQSPVFKDIIIDTSSASTQANDRYWADYPDVAADPTYGTSNPGGAWRHYNQVGRNEGRVWHGELSAGNQYTVKLLIVGRSGSPDDEPHTMTCYLLNVEEKIYTTRTYPNRVLLGITGIQGKQIPNLEAMKVSVLAKCQKVKDYTDALGNYVLRYSRKRCWNTAHFLTNARIGMGYEIDESEIPVAQWLGDAQSYYDEQVEVNIKDSLGTIIDTYDETRDYCDMVISERKWDWEHVKRMVGEGRGIIYPSNGTWKWAVDKPGTAGLLFSEPGNIVEGSITMEVAPPDKYFNQIIAEYRNEDDNDRPGITDALNAYGTGPNDLNLIPTQPPGIVQEAVSFETIRRRTQALRENMVIIKRQFLEKRRWTFTSPQTAIVKEPLDLDWLCERVIADEGAYTGYVSAGSTTTVVVLDNVVEIAVGSTYILIVQFRDGSVAESRTVTTAAGKTATVTVSSGFSHAPAENDIYALGRMDVDHTITRARDLTIDADGRIQQIRSEYVDEVYNPDPMPEGFNPKFFPVVSVPPIPLWDAAVANQNVQRQDGSWASIIMFDVTPGPISYALSSGAIASGTTTSMTLTSGSQIYQNEYWRGSWIVVLTGSNAGQQREVSSYGWQGIFYWVDPMPNAMAAGDEFKLEWRRFSDTHGFKIELTQDQNATWTEVARVVGFHYEMDGGDQGGTWYYRFTPFNVSGVENKTARVIKQITIQGDSVPPPAPVSVLAFATTSIITVEATFALPMALDFAGVDVVVRQYAWQSFPPPGHKVYAVLPLVDTRTGATRENGTSGTVAIIKTVDIRNRFSYPPVNGAWDASVRAYDYSGNKSAWVLSNDFYPQQLTQADIAP